jgi:hypothetical protein
MVSEDLLVGLAAKAYKRKIYSGLKMGAGKGRIWNNIRRK